LVAPGDSFIMSLITLIEMEDYLLHMILTLRRDNPHFYFQLKTEPSINDGVRPSNRSRGRQKSDLLCHILSHGQ
jgi:hypothetical protein